MSAVVRESEFDVPPFTSTRQAIRFALSYEGAPLRPASSRMLDAMLQTRFQALEATAQAGMIFHVLHTLGTLPMSVLIASAAPRIIPCSCRRECCSGRRMNLYYREAVATISRDCVSALPPGSKVNYGLRSAIVLKIYGGGSHLTFVDIAASLGIDQETVSRQHKAIYRWLMGAKATRHAEGVEGIEPPAWREAETALRVAGIVG